MAPTSEELGHPSAEGKTHAETPSATPPVEGRRTTGRGALRPRYIIGGVVGVNQAVFDDRFLAPFVAGVSYQSLSPSGCIDRGDRLQAFGDMGNTLSCMRNLIQGGFVCRGGSVQPCRNGKSL